MFEQPKSPSLFVYPKATQAPSVNLILNKTVYLTGGEGIKMKIVKVWDMYCIWSFSRMKNSISHQYKKTQKTKKQTPNHPNQKPNNNKPTPTPPNTLLGYSKHFLFYSGNKTSKGKTKHTRVSKKPVFICGNTLSNRIRKNPSWVILKLSGCFQQTGFKQSVCLNFLAGRSLFFSVDLAVTERSAIGSREVCDRPRWVPYRDVLTDHWGRSEDVDSLVCGHVLLWSK